MNDQPSKFVAPTWAYSAVCPEGYDYSVPWCKLRGIKDQPPQENPPPGPVAIHGDAVTRAIAVEAWQATDSITAKLNMAMTSAGLALLIAFIALLTMNIDRRRSKGD